MHARTGCASTANVLGTGVRAEHCRCPIFVRFGMPPVRPVSPFLQGFQVTTLERPQTLRKAALMRA